MGVFALDPPSPHFGLSCLFHLLNVMLEKQQIRKLSVVLNNNSKYKFPEKGNNTNLNLYFLLILRNFSKKFKNY